MATLILTDAQTLAKHDLVPFLVHRPGFVIVEAVEDVDDARARILAHRPDIAIIASTSLHDEICSAVTRLAVTEVETRIVYLSAYQDPDEMAGIRAPGLTAILTRENSFEDILSTMLVVLHGGIFQPRLTLETSAEQARNHGLSRREHEVLKGIASGHTTKAMARTLALSPKTIETYRNRLMQKLGLRCMAELVQYAVRNQLT